MSGTPLERAAPGWRGILGLAAMALIVGIGATAAGSACAQSAPKTSATPTSTPTMQELALAYVDVVNKSNSPHEVGGISVPPVAESLAVANAQCLSGSATTCRNASVRLRNSAHAYLADLAKLTVPSCLGAVDKELRAALVMIEDGAGKTITGIDANDANQRAEGARLLTDAPPHLANANAAIARKACGL